MLSSNLSYLKAKIRSEKLLERLSHHPLEKEKKDGMIFQNIINLLEFQKAKTVLFYLPIHGEVDLRSLFENFSFQKKFVLPRMHENNLHLYAVDNLSEIEKGKYGVLEPRIHLPQILPENVEIAFIPGIVFSENFHRIGFGKGFYDRFLKKLRCPKIGVAYDFQIVKNIDGEIHDVLMDKIITEKRILEFLPGSKS